MKYIDTTVDISEEAYALLRKKHSEQDIKYLLRKGAHLEIDKEILEIQNNTAAIAEGAPNE